MNLSLFTQLQGNDVATLLLKPAVGGKLQYFIITATVNYGVVLSGECEGELQNDSAIAFDIVLSTIAPLLAKGYEFVITYRNSVLQFEEVHKKFSIEPLCVEHLADNAVALVDQFLYFNQRLEHQDNVRRQIEDLENQKMAYLANRARDIIENYAGPSGDPWTEMPSPQDNVLSDFDSQIESLGASIHHGEADYSGFGRIADIAARNNTTVSFCGEYAVVQLANSYIFQKGKCGIRAVNGRVLSKLLNRPKGFFFESEEKLIFYESQGKDGHRTNIFVMFQTFLPKVNVDTSLITRGVVSERYELDIYSASKAILPVLNKFEKLTFLLGDAKLELVNDRGERLIYNLEVSDAKTLALNKMMRGEEAGPIVMSNVSIPRELQYLLPKFAEEFTIFVKSRKVVLQSGRLFAVFSGVT